MIASVYFQSPTLTYWAIPRRHGPANIFGITDYSGNFHIETSLGGRIFNILFTFVSQVVFEKSMMKVAILGPF
jgi:hypothetical protein